MTQARLADYELKINSQCEDESADEHIYALLSKKHRFLSLMHLCLEMHTSQPTFSIPILYTNPHGFLVLNMEVIPERHTLMELLRNVRRFMHLDYLPKYADPTSIDEYKWEDRFGKEYLVNIRTMIPPVDAQAIQGYYKQHPIRPSECTQLVIYKESGMLNLEKKSQLHHSIASWNNGKSFILDWIEHEPKY